MKLISKRTILEMLGCSPGTFEKLIRDHDFPEAAIRLTDAPNSPRKWLECEAIEWLSGRIAEQSHTEIGPPGSSQIHPTDSNKCSLRCDHTLAKYLQDENSARDRNLLLAEVRDCTISGPRNPAVVCFTSLLSSLTAISSPHPFCFLSTTHNLP